MRGILLQRSFPSAPAAGYRVGTIVSTTWEEACSHVPAWIRQRTRWIKGYMVTTLVDARYPIKFAKSAGWKSLVTLIGLIAGTPLMFLAYPIVWGLTLIVYVGFATDSFQLPGPLGAFAVFNALFGNRVQPVFVATIRLMRLGCRAA